MTRTELDGEDVLVPTNGDDGVINIDSGTVDGAKFDVTPGPHDIVVTVQDNSTTVEVARLRAPSARIQPEDSDRTGCSRPTAPPKSDVEPAADSPASSSNRDPAPGLTETAESRLADIVDLQPTSNSELADVWGLSSGSDVYKYLSTELEEYYYRDDEKYIRATTEAEQLLQSTR